MESIRVLYVEDDPADQELTRRHLEHRAPHLKLQMVGTVSEALDQLAAGDVDVVLSDYRLPDATGLDLLTAMKARESMVPVVLVTGSGDADAAVRLLKAGAADYVVKRSGYLPTLPPVLEGAFQWSQSVRELRGTAIRVLYAEHDPAEVELTRRAFREHGPHFHLDVACRGRDALDRLRTTPYDLLLLDNRIPDLSGIEILKAIREERIRIAVVMVTGHGDEETAVQAFKLGAADYIIKRESDLPKLPTTLENVLAQRRLADEKDALIVLNGLTKSIATLRDMGELLQRVARAARDLLRTDTSVLWLVDGTELSPASWAGLEESAAHTLRFQVDERLLNRAVSERRVAISDLLAYGESAHPTVAVLAHADRTLAVSLVTAACPVGLLAVASQGPRAFSATEERLLTILADHAAIAIENVRLYEELKERLDELQRTQAQLLQTEKLAAMGQLLAGVAHELNNPLAVVMGQSALLRQSVPDGTLATRADKITQAAERSARIVRSFLALARHRPPERQPVRLNQVIQEAVELLAYQLRVDTVEVTLDLAEELPPLWGDPHQLHQVVVNLVTNAQQAMRQMPLPRRLTLTTRAESACARVSLEVADTGPGIPPDIQARIFEPFFTTKPVGQGTGLGLALCHGIIEGHRGSIRLESQPGQGAVFRIELPVEARQAMEAAARVVESQSPIRGKTILVVDDEPEVAAVLADMLALDGHQVQTAANGVIALDTLRERTYDLIFSDLRMPELDGPGLYRELERREPRLCRRVVFLTGDTLSGEIMEFLEKTRARSLEKPFAQGDVQKIVQQVLRVEQDIYDNHG